MKLVFLVTLFFLASDWPTPSVCWPALNQQYGSMESTPLSAIFGQQMLSNQLNGYGMNTMYGGGLPSRFNPDLMKALTGAAANDQQLGAFNRLSSQGKSKKLSNTKFMLKPFKTTEEEVDEKPIEEVVDEAPALTKKTIKQEIPLAERIKSVFKSEQNVDKVVKQATATEEEQKTAAAKIHQQQQEQIEQLTKTVEAAKAKEAAAATEEIVNKLAQQQQQQQQQKVEQTSQTTSVEQTLAESAAKAEHPNVKAVQQEIPEFHQAPQHAYTAPSAAASESIRTLSSKNRASPQQQQTYNPMYADDSRQLQFKLEVPDNINSVGLDTIRNEMTRQLNIRKLSNMDNSDNKYQQQQQQQQPQYNNNNYRTPFVNPFYNAPQPAPVLPASGNANPFSSLIIIVNSNANANLGVTFIDTDLFKSFLSQFAGKSVDDVLRDASLEEIVKAFNRERERSTKSTNNGKENKESKSKDNSKNYESTTKLSANVPTYSSAGDQVEPDSHSESTVLLRRSGANVKPYGGAYANVNPYANPANTYNYVPYGMGGLIVINNANNNINKRIRSILSGKEINTSKYNPSVAFPLSHEHIEKLMEDAVIVNNDNSNTNVH